MLNIDWKHLFLDTSDTASPKSYAFWIYLMSCLVIVILASIMAGLTVGLMSIDPLKFKLLKKSGNRLELKKIVKLEPLLKNRHFLLSTIVATNCVCMELLPLLMEKLLPHIIAFLLSVTLILVFAEILPQALFLSNPLGIGSKFVWLIKILQFIFYPIAKPISWIVHKLVPNEEDNILLKRKEIKELLLMHTNSDIESGGEIKTQKSNELTRKETFLADFNKLSTNAIGLHKDEVLLMKGAFNLSSCEVQSIMKPLKSIFMLDVNTILTKSLCKKILDCGFSRIPLYKNERQNIVGFLLVKKLIGADLDEKLTLKYFMNHSPLVFNKNLLCGDALNQFQNGKSHIAIIKDKQNNNQFIGMITLEDLIELLIGEKISDETDYHFKE